MSFEEQKYMDPMKDIPAREFTDAIEEVRWEDGFYDLCSPYNRGLHWCRYCMGYVKPKYTSYKPSCPKCGKLVRVRAKYKKRR